MLQCLCGRSLKKNKNPTGEFVARVRFRASGIDFVACLCVRTGVCARPEAALFGCCFSAIADVQQVSALEAGSERGAGDGGGREQGRGGDNLEAQNMTGVAVRVRGECVRGVRMAEMLQKIKSNAARRPVQAPVTCMIKQHMALFRL